MKYQNSQLYCECNLVSLLNVLKFYGMDEKVPEMGSSAYEEMCVKYHCISGACIGVLSSCGEYGLELITGKLDYDWIRNNLPVALSVYCKQGCHSILAVKCRGDKFLVTNYAKGRLQWLTFSQIRKMKVGPNECFLPRAFKIKNNYDEILRKG